MKSTPDNTLSPLNPETPLSESIILTQYRMPALQEDFYSALVRRILPYCGNEYRTQDFHSAVGVLDSQLKLRLDDVHERALSLLLTGLSQASRFGSDIHVGQGLGENSAVHSCHTAVLMNEMFRRAGLLEKKSQSPEVIEMRVETTLASIIHDMGEILGEFTSLAQRAADAGLEEDPFLERKVFETALHLAFLCAQEDSADLFYHALQEMRDKVEELRRSGAALNLDGILEEYRPDNIPGEVEGYVQAILGLFDMTELRDDAELCDKQRFRGYAVKVIEHTQGTRHLLRFATHEPEYERLHIFSGHSPDHTRMPQDQSGENHELTVPLSLCPSTRMSAALKYLEPDIGCLFKYAKSPAELALARAIRDTAYETIIEMLHASSHLYDRKAKENSPMVKELLKRVWDKSSPSDVRRANVAALRLALEAEQDGLLARVRAYRRNTHNFKERKEDTLFDIETAEHLLALYLRALEVGYEPKPGEILALGKTVPEALRPLAPLRLAQLCGDRPHVLPLWQALGVNVRFNGEGS